MKKLVLLLINLGLGIVYYSAGVSKLAPYHIGNFIGPVDLGEKLQSDLIKVMMLFVAIYQLIVGFLLLSVRYALVGQIMLLPLSIGILTFTIVTGFQLTPVINAIFLLLNLILLWVDREAIKEILQSKTLTLDRSFFFANISKSHDYFTWLIILNFVFALVCAFYSAAAPYLLPIVLLAFSIQAICLKGLTVLDKIIVALFYLVCFHIMGGIWLATSFSKQLFIYSLATSALMFVVFGLIRLVISLFRKVLSSNEYKHESAVK